ncbi:MAG: hypothetical protein RMJ31_07720 [Nitrososphaerota archaeon]|nr:hypothetical protein [Nitrososphaerota archaeon]
MLATLPKLEMIQLRCASCGKFLNCYAPIDYTLIFCERCKGK